MRQISSTRRVRRTVGGLVGAVALMATAACGFNAQTLQPYTPAEGVNVNVGVDAQNQPTANTVEVRGLMVISKEPGSGFLSASMTTRESDTLTGVTGTVIKTDGSTGSQLTVTLPAPVAVTSDLTVLTNGPRINVESADLAAGYTVNLTLTFAQAGSKTVIAPVIDGNFLPYSTVSPTPAASSASPSATPSS